MFVLCMMLCIILNNTMHGVEPKWKEDREERQDCKYFNASCVTFCTFEIDAAGKYLRLKSILYYSVQPCYLCKYSNRSMTLLYMTI